MDKFDKTIDTPPGEFTVTCRSAPYGEDKRRVWHRVGNYAALSEAEEAIKRDKASMGETFGGLMAPTPTKGREYAIWHAKWERVK